MLLAELATKKIPYSEILKKAVSDTDSRQCMLHDCLTCTFKHFFIYLRFITIQMHQIHSPVYQHVITDDHEHIASIVHAFVETITSFLKGGRAPFTERTY